MFCEFQYYSYDTEELQDIVNHSDESYKCEKMSDCPYTGTTIINKIPWGEVGWVWSPQEADQEGGGMMEVRYDVVRDSYFTTNTKGGDREGWRAGVWRCENIQRREPSFPGRTST